MVKFLHDWKGIARAVLLAAMGSWVAPALADTAAADCGDRPYCIGAVSGHEVFAAWDINVLPDGTGLPDGQGDFNTGKKVYAEQCAACHGEGGLGGIKPIEDHAGYPALVSESPTPLSSIDQWPTKNIGTYLPYATTVFDYIRRAMPFTNSQSLTNDEVYSLVAYLLALNKVIPEDKVLSKANLAAIEMPNRNGFSCDSRPDTSNAKCMEGCAVPGDANFDLGKLAERGSDSQVDCMVLK